jgi:hypothetical protein
METGVFSMLGHLGAGQSYGAPFDLQVKVGLVDTR